jgi:hypothetical protein
MLRLRMDMALWLMVTYTRKKISHARHKEETRWEVALTLSSRQELCLTLCFQLIEQARHTDNPHHPGAYDCMISYT